jgi:predicted nucleic acid-binding protein
MKVVVFDTGPIISLTMNNLLWLLKRFKDSGKVEFYITDKVKEELVDNPLNKTKRFKFEALQVLKQIELGTLKVESNDEVKKLTSKLLSAANSCFGAFGRDMKLIHEAEMSALALCIQKKADAFAVDEKTTRLFIENPKKLFHLLKHNFHTKISIDRGNLNDFRKMTKGIKIIRSVELATIAFEKKFLDKYLTNVMHPKKTLLESVLWGIKLSGCAVSKKEIEKIMRIEA